MNVEQAAFHLQKAGNAPGDYEDAFYQPSSGGGKRRSYRYAIADGATEMSFSGLWANLLVKAYGDDRLGKQLDPRSLLALRQQWKSHVEGKPLPWYAEEKARLGAFSSLLGLRLSASRAAGTWQAIAVGDSCLFQLRGSEVLTAFPLKCSADFNNRPVLISSNSADAMQPRELPATAEGQWHDRDVFLLMTDALACWFLRSKEAGEQPSELLGSLVKGDEHGAFPEFIRILRTSGKLRNDDVTLLIVEPRR
jgi:hypothetical protein